MQNTSVKPRRGQPKRHAIDRIRTKVWYHELSQQARTSKPKWFWYQIDNNDHVKNADQSKSPIDEYDLAGSWSKWSKYSKGETLPVLFAGKHSVEEAAIFYPCSDHIFHSPIWKFLKQKHVTTKEARASMMGLHSPVRDIILPAALVPPCGTLNSSFSIDNIFSQLSEIPTLDTFQAIILFLAWANDDGNSLLWNKACALYRTMIPEFLLNEEIPFPQELFSALDLVAKERLYHHGVFRDDIDRSWLEELPRLKLILKQHYSSCLRSHYMFFRFTEKKFPKHKRDNLAETMVEIVWERGDLKFRSKDLWQPLSDFLLTNSLMKKREKRVTEKALLAEAFKSIDDFFKDTKKCNKINENPLPAFDSESYILSTTFNRTHVYHPDMLFDEFY